MNSYRFRLLGGAVAAFALAGGAQAQDTIKVGVLASYSGPSATSGIAVDNTIKLFLQLNGDTAGGRKVEFVKRDSTGPNPEVARRMAQELIVREKVQILLGPDFTPNVLAVAPLLTEAKVPAIVQGAATQGLTEKSPYFVRTFFSIPQSVRPMAQWAAKNNVRKIVMLVADYGPGQDAETTFTKAFTELGGTIASTIKVPVRNPEFSGYIQRIKDAGADAVFVFLPIGELPIQFLKAYSDAGLKDTPLKLLGTGDLTDESLLDAAGDTALGVITTGFYSPTHDSGPNRKFVADYTAAFGKTPRMAMSHVTAWDTMQLLYAGLEAQKGAKFDADKFVATLKGYKFESPRGPVTIDKATGDIVQNAYVRRVERRDGLLQNVEFDTFRDVPAK